MKRKFKGAVCALLTILALSFSSCNNNAQFVKSFEAMDTIMSLTTYGDSEVNNAIESRILSLDVLLSTTDENSEIFALNMQKTATLSDDTAELLSRGLRLCDELDGDLDLSVYPAVQAWGFTTESYNVPTADELESLAENIDYTAVTLSGNVATIPQNVTVDLGAIAKGYVADIALDMLENSTASGAVLNLGGTICLYGNKPDGSRFKVGVTDPDNTAGYFGYLSCDSGIIATSGDYERYFVADDGTKYIHIIDPKTAEPVDNGTVSVTVICDSGTTADALSTALFVKGVEGAIRYYREQGDFDFIILDNESNVYISEGIFDDFALSDGYDLSLVKVSRA